MPPPKQHSHKKGKGNFQERQQSIKKMLEKEKHEEEIKSRSAKLVKLKKKIHLKIQMKKKKKKKEKIDSVDGEEAENDDESEDEIKIEPFNLTQEREQGVFDGHGNYTLKRKDERIIDPWLYEYDENLSHSKKKALYKPKPQQIDERPLEPINLEQQKHNVLNYLKEGETVVQALKRLSKTNDTQKEFDALTEAAHLCLSANFYNIYHETREKIEDSIPVTNAVNTDAYGS